jgi:branched-chain amino acid transport system permease protein
MAALLIAVLAGLTAVSVPAMADDSDGGGDAGDVSINVLLLDRGERTKESPAGSPIPGVTITVLDAEGAEVGSAETNRQGAASVPVPGSGTFDVELDADTLPEGTELSDPDQLTLTGVQVLGFDKTVQFPIGLAASTDVPLWDKALGLLISGLKFGLLIALAGLGLSMIFGTTGLTNFAHGELITLGALVAYGFNQGLGLHIMIAGTLAVLVTFCAGAAQDLGFWRPLRKRGTGNIALMIVSIGLAIFLRNLYLYFFGGTTKPYAQYATQSSWDLGAVSIAPKELFIILVAIVVLVAVSLLLSRTRLGKATRAVADNPALAASSGINVSMVITIVWILGTGLAGLSGVLLGLDQQVEHQMGFKLLLLVFAAVTLGGLGTIWGAMAGSILVGVMVDMSTLFLSVELKNIGALIVLILVLLFRPQGIFGRRERVG